MLAQAQVGAVDDDRRRHGRVPVSWSAQVTEADPTAVAPRRDSAIAIHVTSPKASGPAGEEDGVPCQVLDFSAGGARLRLSGTMALLLTQIDDSLVLTLGHGAFTGRVAWRRGAEIGLSFHHMGPIVGFPPLPKPGSEVVYLN